MPVLMKKPPINVVDIIILGGIIQKFRVPRQKVQGLLLLLQEFKIGEETPKTVPSEEVFKNLDKQFSRPGAALQGARLKEELSQIALAKKLCVSQGDLSKMEHGKRPIGKKMAKRLSKILKVDYRIFL